MYAIWARRFVATGFAVLLLVLPAKAFAAVVPAPQLSSPLSASTSTNLKPSFRWNPSGRATTYRLQVTKNSDMSFLAPIINLTVRTTNFTPANAMSWDTYRWRVKVVDRGLKSGWSNVWQHTINPSLTASDEQALTSNLETLSQTWDTAAITSANAILAKPEYSASDWQNYFDTFFNTTNHPFTFALYDYLGYPFYFWLDQGTHERLQGGISQPLWTKVNTLMSAEKANLGPALDVNTNLRESLFSVHRFFDSMGHYGVVQSVRDTTYANYKTLINQYPQYFKAGAIDAASQPYVPTLRAQVWMSFRDIKQTLDETTKNEIATTLGLSGRYLDVWNNFSTLLHDNNKFSIAQREVLYNVMESIPNGMLSLASITQNEMLGNTGRRQYNLHSSTGVNIFPTDVGTSSENSFPSDITPGSIDNFSAALAHELNHVIEVGYVNTDSLRSTRRDTLRNQAGSVDLQYLRNMVGGVFFQQNPQEFIASISNQWFTDSKQTLALGLQRFDQGYSEPLNQALYFADLYSREGTTSRFYQIGSDGVVRLENVVLKRDYYGRIVELTYGGFKYSFTLNHLSNVTAYIKVAI